MIDRVLPYDLDTERALLGAMLYGNPDIIDAVNALVRDTHFYASPHTQLFRAICAVHKSGTPVDQVTVMDEVQKMGADRSKLVVLIVEALNDVVTDQNAEHYAKLVARDFQRREIVRRAEALVNQAYDKTHDFDDVLQNASHLSEQASTCDMTQWVPLPDAVNDAMNHYEQVWQNPGKMTGVTTGLADLDDITDGLQAGDLVLVGARPGAGKTSFGVFAATAAQHATTPVAFVTIEMSARQIAGRFITLGALVDSYVLRKGGLSHSDYERLTRAEAQLKQAPITLLDNATDINAIIAHIRMLKRKLGVGLVIVDYLQLVRGHRERNDNREREIAGISWAFKMLAKDLSIPIVVLCQLNRAIGSRTDKRPQLFDLRESGSLEQDADVVLMLHRPILYGERIQEKQAGVKVDVTRLAEVIVAKHRNGPTGTIKASVDMATGHWADWAEENHILT